MQKNESDSKPIQVKFWISSLMALLERAAFFAVAPIFVVYLHEILNINPAIATVLNGSLLWGLIYFLPPAGTQLTNYLGVKQSLSIAFVSLSLGYLFLGNIQRLWPAIIGSNTAEVLQYTIPVTLAILLIGIGGSLARTGTAGVIQQSNGGRTTMAMGLFFLIINIGALTGLVTSFILRTGGLKLFPLSDGSHFIQVTPGLENGFSYIGTVLCLTCLLILIFFFKSDGSAEALKDNDFQTKTGSRGHFLSGISQIVKNKKILKYFFLVGVFWLIYAQIFNLIPLYLRFLHKNAPVELYIMILPVTLLTFQLPVSRYIDSWKTGRATVIGMLTAILGILVNLVPLVFFKGNTAQISLWGIEIPLGGLFILISLMLLAIGEMILSPRLGDYRDLPETGNENKPERAFGNLPVVAGIVIGAPLGGLLFEYFITGPQKKGMEPQPAYIWSIIAALGLLSLLGLVRFFHSVKKEADSSGQIPG